MAEANDFYGSIYQNLIDAGCNKETTEKCMSCIGEKKVPETLKILARHRDSLLGSLHREQKRIDCLDFLIYRLKEL
ncbi:MAG: hypothetical protein LUD77_07965 [Clostridiales bacterium]|nr:hypothetical protein [Clostridiales bacterium]